MKIVKNELLSKYTTFKIGGPARYFVVVKTKKEMIDALNYAFSHNLKYFLLGGGANVLFQDKEFDGVVIKNEMSNINFKLGGKETFVEVDSGVNMNLLVNECVEKEYGGLEYFAGHPGTVGGSVFINAHTKNEEGKVLLLGDKVINAKIYNLINKKEEEIDHDFFQFAYDFSKLKDTRDILLSVVFRLERDCFHDLDYRRNWILNYRKTTQDYGGHTAGCVFQNTEKGPAGKLIDECGLKGIQFGGAKISEKHANFIVNTGRAKSSDIICLINLCKEKVREKFGVELKEEIVIV